MPACENKGCVRIKKDEEIYVPLDDTALFYCPDEDGPGHPEYVWCVKNTTGKAGFIVAEKEGYTTPAPTNHEGTVTAQRAWWDCETGKYVVPVNDPQNPIQEFRIYRYCRDKKCRPA